MTLDDILNAAPAPRHSFHILATGRLRRRPPSIRLPAACCNPALLAPRELGATLLRFHPVHDRRPPARPWLESLCPAPGPAFGTCRHGRRVSPHTLRSGDRLQHSSAVAEAGLRNRSRAAVDPGIAGNRIRPDHHRANLPPPNRVRARYEAVWHAIRRGRR